MAVSFTDVDPFYTRFTADIWFDEGLPGAVSYAQGGQPCNYKIPLGFNTTFTHVRAQNLTGSHLQLSVFAINPSHTDYVYARLATGSDLTKPTWRDIVGPFKIESKQYLSEYTSFAPSLTFPEELVGKYGMLQLIQVSITGSLQKPTDTVTSYYCVPMFFGTDFGTDTATRENNTGFIVSDFADFHSAFKLQDSLPFKFPNGLPVNTTDSSYATRETYALGQGARDHNLGASGFPNQNNTGMIAAAVVGGILLLVTIILVPLIWLRCFRRIQQRTTSKDSEEKEVPSSSEYGAATLNEVPSNDVRRELGQEHVQHEVDGASSSTELPSPQERRSERQDESQRV